MREFFKGWRRKAGLVTLVIACMLMGLWMRSYGTMDQISYSPYSVISVRGRIAAICDARTIPRSLPIIISHSASEILNFQPDVDGNCPVWWETLQSSERWDFAGYHLARNGQDGSPSCEIGFPNLSITIPLTVLAAFLLLAPTPKRPIIESRTDA